MFSLRQIFQWKQQTEDGNKAELGCGKSNRNQKKMKIKPYKLTVDS